MYHKFGWNLGSMLLTKIEEKIKWWRHNDSPQPKKYRQEENPLKVMFIVAYDFDGVLVTHSVSAGNRVNGAYYSYFLEHLLRSPVHRKHPNLLNSHLIVLHDGARSPIAAPVVNLLRRRNWEILEHPPYPQIWAHVILTFSRKWNYHLEDFALEPDRQ